MQVIYLRESLSNKLEGTRRIIKSVFAPIVIKEDGSLEEYMSDRSLNTLILSFEASQILSDKDQFDSFIKIMNTREPTEQLIKEYYYDSEFIGNKILEISKKYNQATRKHILPKPSKIIQAIFASLFLKRNEANLIIYFAVFLHAKRTGIISKEGLDCLFEKLDPEILDDIKQYGQIQIELTRAFNFINSEYDFALSVLENINEIAEDALELLSEIYASKIEHVNPLSNAYLRLFRKVKTSIPGSYETEFQKATMLSGMLNMVIEGLQSMSYLEDPSYSTIQIINPTTSRLIEKLHEKGINTESEIKLPNDLQESSIVKSLLNIYSYVMRADKLNKIETLYLKMEDQEK